MSLLTSAPSFFAALSSENTTHSEETIGVAASTVTLNATTRVVWIFNTSGSVLYFRLDGTVVTTSNGFPIPGGAPFELVVKANQALQLISGTAAQDVRILQVAL